MELWTKWRGLLLERFLSTWVVATENLCYYSTGMYAMSCLLNATFSGKNENYKFLKRTMILIQQTCVHSPWIVLIKIYMEDRRVGPKFWWIAWLRNIRVSKVNKQLRHKQEIPVTFKLAWDLRRGTSTKPMGNMPSASTVKAGLR